MAYDAFISYSHAADGQLAPALQRGLQRLAKPWNRRRALNIFRDETGLSTNPHLWFSVQAALDDSESFILLASPEAAASEWVNKEIEHWLATKTADHILPVVTDGTWMWDTTARDYSPDSTAVPQALRGAQRDEPRHLDLRWARTETDLDLRNTRFRDAIADLAAPLHGLPKDELEGEDIRQHRRARRLARGGVSVLSLLVVVALVTSGIAYVQRNRAREQSRIATAGRLAALATARASTGLDESLLLGVEGSRIVDTIDTRSGLINALATSPSLVRLRHPWKADVLGTTVSPDGTRFATLGADGSAQVFDTRSARALTPLIRALDAPLSAGAFSPDDHTLVVGSRLGALRVVDVVSGAPVGDPILSSPVPSLGDGLAFAPDGSSFVEVNFAGELRRFAMPGAVPVEGAPSFALSNSGAVTFTPDGQGLVLAVTGSISFLDATSGSTVTTRAVNTPGGAFSLGVSPDNRLLAVGGALGAVRLYDLPGLEPHAVQVGGHEGIVNSLRFNQDGSRLVGASDDGTVRVWDTTTGAAALPPLVGHTGRAVSAWFAVAGEIESVGPSELATWTLRPRAVLGSILTDRDSRPADAEIHRAGDVVMLDPRTVAVGGVDGAVHLRDVVTGREVRRPMLTGHETIRDIARATDGSLAVAASGVEVDSPGPVLVWHSLSGPRAEFPVLQNWWELEYSPDGRRLAFTDLPGAVRVIDARTGRDALSLDVNHNTGPVEGLTFSPDGRLLVSGSTDGRVAVWNAITGRLVRRIGATRSRVSALAIGQDARLVVATHDGQVQVVDVTTGHTIGATLALRGVYATHLAFSESGDILAIGASDGGVTLWDLRTRALLGRALGGHRQQVNGIVFADHDHILVTGAGDGTVAFRSLSPATWQRQACALAGRNLTKAEWRQFLGNRAYHKTCAQWPAGK